MSLFLLLLLLINPTIRKTELENTKPVLAVLVDNSKSIPFFKETKNITTFLSEIKNDKSIKEKFDINSFSFGSDVKPLDSLSFKEFSIDLREE